MYRAAFLIALLLIPALITASANQDEPLASTATVSYTHLTLPTRDDV